MRLSRFWLSSGQDCLQSIKQMTERMSRPGTTFTVWKASCLEYAYQEHSSWPLHTRTFTTVTIASLFKPWTFLHFLSAMMACSVMFNIIYSVEKYEHVKRAWRPAGKNVHTKKNKYNYQGDQYEDGQMEKIYVCWQKKWFLMLRITLSRRGISKPGTHHQVLLLVAFWVT